MNPQKKFFLLALFILTSIPNTVFAVSQNQDLKQYDGQILIQVESYGRAWYVYPKEGTRYYLRNGDMAFSVWKDLAQGIRHSDLVKIPAEKGERGDTSLRNRFAGFVLLDVDDKGRMWYVNPEDKLRYSVTNTTEAFSILKNLGKPVKNTILKKIPMNAHQLTSDFTFSSVAYALFDGTRFDKHSQGDHILPLASLTKLVTAMVLIDENFDFNKKIKITRDHITYPTLYAQAGETSEIALKEGYEASADDLWVAMLVASSNQAAIALVDNSKLTRKEFVDKMNVKAKGLGLVKTVFFEPAGLDPHNVSTAKEFALIADRAFNIPKIRNTTVLASYTILAVDEKNSEHEVNIINRNYSLLKFEPQGAKTGFLVEAQRNATLKKGDKTIVVLHAYSMAQRNGIIKKLLQ